MDTQSDILSPIPEPAPERRSLFRGLNDLLRFFSPSERLFLYVLTLSLALSTFVLVIGVNDAVSTHIPAAGGTLTEGGAGTPRFVNPILATSQVDQDLTTLTYSGLLRPADGEYKPDIAETYEISDDGTVYTFHLKKGLTFHDGEPITSTDVIFTVSLAQNPDIKSPRRADWEGVAVAAPDEHTVIFTLPHAYAPFLENATLGVLPRHLWQDVTAEEFPFHALNTHPVGSGPYAVEDVKLDTTGAPTEYTLKAFKEFALGAPHLTSIVYRAFANEEEVLAAARAGDIESFVASSPKKLPREVEEGATLVRVPLTRIFGVFLNQNHATVLASASVRHALDAAIDKEGLVRDVLGGYGSTLAGPVPAEILSGAVAGAASTSATTTPEVETSPTDTARDILSAGGWRYADSAATTSGGWKKGTETLTLTLATADTEELVATAERIAAAWRAAGINVEVEVYPLSEFNQDILRPRSYDAILFGEAVGRSLDLYPFWHSSQRNDPGLNLSLYTNADADDALAKARAATKQAEREKFIREFLETVSKDDPAVFLYSPTLAYLVPSHLQGIAIGPISSPSERFWGVHTWYRDTERVWDIFE